MSISTASTTSRPVARRVTTLALGACLVGSVSGAALSAPAALGAEQQSVRILQATLKPSGDPDGSGHATFRIRKARGRVCADVTWSSIQKPDAAHIHRRSTGAIVVDLTGTVTGGAHCATGVRHKLIGKILEHPRRFYFNVHNATYPAGAISGPLHR